MFKEVESEELKKLDKEPAQKLNFDWLHRPKNELDDLIERIKSDTDLHSDESIKPMRKTLLNFLDNIVTGKIDNEKDAKKEYLTNIFGHVTKLKRKKIYKGSRSQRMLGFINGDYGAAYIVFGPLFSSKKDMDSESEKFDTAMGGKSESESDEETYESKYEIKGKGL